MKPNFKSRTIFSKNLAAISHTGMGKTKLYFNKPIYLGMSILHLSKTLIFDFHYNYIKNKYDANAKLLFTDTDSLCYEIETSDFYQDIAPDVPLLFDTSNFPKDHPSIIPVGMNKKVPAMFKDEDGGAQIVEFVGLRSKLYSYKTCTDETGEVKKCKGVKYGVVKTSISHQNYKDCLFSNNPQMRKMNVIRSHLHNIYTETVNKVALCNKDDKRIIREDGIHTYAFGHFRTLLGGNSESLGTTCNSSLTNPRFGTPSK